MPPAPAASAGDTLAVPPAPAEGEVPPDGVTGVFSSAMLVAPAPCYCRLANLPAACFTDP